MAEGGSGPKAEEKPPSVDGGGDVVGNAALAGDGPEYEAGGLVLVRSTPPPVAADEESIQVSTPKKKRAKKQVTPPPLTARRTRSQARKEDAQTAVDTVDETPSRPKKKHRRVDL